jgi:TPR repeat protein
LWLVPPREKPILPEVTKAPPVAVAPAPPQADPQVAGLAASKAAQAELERKLAALELRLKNEAEARNKADAKVEAEARKRAEAERKRQEEARRAAAAAAAAAAPPPVKSVEPTPKPAPAPAPASVIAPPPAPDLLALAEQARTRGNDAESLALYRKAADQGNAKAQFTLGEMYAAGRGVPQNNFQAYIWYSKAVRAGNAEAKPRVEQVKAALQPAEIQQADRLLR